MRKVTEINKVINELRKGKIPAYEKLFKLYYPRLFKYAHHFLEDSFVTEDLIQEVFIEVWDKRKLFVSEKQFTSYLFKIVRNKCLNILKRKVIEEKYLSYQAQLKSEELYHISFRIEDDFDSMEKNLSQIIEDVITQMPDRCREAFRLKWIEGKKIREISKIMNISTTMVDKHLAKGLEIAREKLIPPLLLLYICTKGENT
ncbi:RNA polymerase sigma-70 factor [Maribellus comscasis]|uniref:RNA polymerase sigma factor n=1 Tax=Maribellus comscasis TaxID=2681766 RepID=A0A6I6JTQ7_9BACT|nr:RNA polymerase sigma-70 factor [Maribellus comscasis]QGY43512.1 RNA polymerase sigma-70 factor [Maribellus comscasis]